MVWVSAQGSGAGHQGLWFTEQGLWKVKTAEDGDQRQKAGKMTSQGRALEKAGVGASPSLDPCKLLSGGISGDAAIRLELRLSEAKRSEGPQGLSPVASLTPGPASCSQAKPLWCGGQFPGTLRMKPERFLVKSGSGWLSRVSTETVHFFPCRLHCTGLVTFT